MTRRTGFSAIEMMVTVSIVAFLLAVGVPSFHAMQRTMALQNTANEVTDAIRTARNRALTGQGGEDHGIRFTATTYELFSSSGTPETHTLPSGMSITSSQSQVVFSRLLGQASTPVDLSIGYSDGTQKSIDVLTSGTVTTL